MTQYRSMRCKKAFPSFLVSTYFDYDLIEALQYNINELFFHANFK